MAQNGIKIKTSSQLYIKRDDANASRQLPSLRRTVIKARQGSEIIDYFGEKGESNGKKERTKENRNMKAVPESDAERPV